MLEALRKILPSSKAVALFSLLVVALPIIGVILLFNNLIIANVQNDPQFVTTTVLFESFPPILDKIQLIQEPEDMDEEEDNNLSTWGSDEAEAYTAFYEDLFAAKPFDPSSYSEERVDLAKSRFSFDCGYEDGDRECKLTVLLSYLDKPGDYLESFIDYSVVDQVPADPDCYSYSTSCIFDRWKFDGNTASRAVRLYNFYDFYDETLLPGVVLISVFLGLGGWVILFLELDFLIQEPRRARQNP